MRRRPALLAIAVVLVSLAASRAALARPVSLGPVLDGETLEPVAGATVEVAGKQATSNGAGMVTLRDLPDELLSVHITADGYEDMDEDVASPAALADHVFVLFRPGAVGEVIEVSGTTATRRPAQGAQELSREELSRIPGTGGDALRSIKSLPGVATVDAAGNGPGLLVIRGSAPEDSLILIDGIEVPIAYHFFGLQSVLPTEFIETLDFLPGGFGVEYGRATGGVLSISTRNVAPDKVEGFAETSFTNVAALVQGPVSRADNLTFAAALRRSTIDLLLPVVVPPDANLDFVTAPAYYDGQLRVDWRPGFRHRLTAFALGSYDLLSLINDNVNPNEPELTGKFSNTTGFTRLITTWSYEGDKLDNRLVGAIGTTDFSVDIGTDQHLVFDTRRIEARDDATYRLSDRLTLRGGGEARETRSIVDVRFPLPPGEGTGGVFNFSTAPLVMLNATSDAAVLAAYGAVDLRPTPTTTITSGLRVDYFQRFDDVVVGPRLSIEQTLGKDTTLRAALGSYSRHAEQSEALTRSLDPELATQYVIGGERRLAEGVTATLSGFYTDRRALVEQDAARAAVDPINAYVNRGYGRSFGSEAVLRMRRKNLFGWLAYTLSRSDRVDGVYGQRRLFDFDQTHILVAVASYKLGPWEFGGRWQYATGQPTTPVVGSVYQADLNLYLPVLGDINGDRLETNHQLDLRVDRRWDFADWQLAAFLDVTNVYAHPRVLGVRYNFDFSERETIHDLPIVPSLGVRGSF